MNRRNFLKGAAFAPAAVAALKWPTMGETITPRNNRITAVVFDERYIDCTVFSEVLARLGAAAFPTCGDAAIVWYGRLRKLLERHGGSVAGMTTESDRMVSRACGRELNMRMTYEASHDCRASGRLTHRLRGCGEEREVYAALLRDEAPWAEAVANALGRPTVTDRIAGVFVPVPTVTTTNSASHPGYLTSWLVASS
jgi:hypothetical protein